MINKFTGGNMKKLFTLLAFSFIGLTSFLRAQCFEVSISTCVGDFANGGDVDTEERLLGNTSAHSFGILQDNIVRIYITSGSKTIAGSTGSPGGFVGINYNGINQIPIYTFDVNGIFRSTGSAYLATSSGTVGIGTIPVNANYWFEIGNNTFSVVRNGMVSISSAPDPTMTDTVLNVNGLARFRTIKFTDNSQLTRAPLDISVSSIAPRNYDIVVGTLGANGWDVDIASNNENGIIAAISRCGGQPCTILQRRGIYTANSVETTTVPWNVKIISQSSAVWSPSPANLLTPSFLISGSWENLQYDYSNIAFATSAIRLSTGARISCSMARNKNATAPFIDWTGSTNTIVDIKMDHFTGKTDKIYYGDNATLAIKYASQSVISVETDNYEDYVPNSYTFGFNNCRDIKITNSKIKSSGGNFWLLGVSVANIEISNSDISITTGFVATGWGYLMWNPFPNYDGGVSTFTWIHDITLTVKQAGSPTMDIFRPEGRSSSPPQLQEVSGVWISNVAAKCGISAGCGNVKFVNVSAAFTNRTILSNNNVTGIGTFISNSGSGTLYQSLGNFFNGIEQ